MISSIIVDSYFLLAEDVVTEAKSCWVEVKVASLNGVVECEV